MSESQTKTCQNCQSSFVIVAQDFQFYEKINVPPPTFCWLCRAQRRFAFRNERALFKRKSDFSGKDIFATYPQSVPFPVYAQNEWFSDEWDPMEHGQDYDFSRPFFEQFQELSNKVPKPAKSATGFSKNSDYSNNCTNLKNCYLIFNAGYDEDCAYGNAVNHSNNCFDNANVYRCELTYENFNSARSSRSFFSVLAVDSTDIYFSKNLRGCNDCFGCVNLRNKSYYIFNRPYAKEEYRKKIEEFDFGSYASLGEIAGRAYDSWLQFPCRFMEKGTTSVDVSGEYVYGSKNVKKTYQAIGGEDLRYCQYVNYRPIKDCYDHSVYGENTELSYECAMVGDHTYNTRFCLQTWTSCKDLEYCEYCVSSSDLFGCVGLRNKQHCILNKQYSKESFDKLRMKIITHMNEMPYIDKGGREYRYGEFFPAEFSPFGYNETIAQEHFPLTREEILGQGYNWRDIESSKYSVTVEPNQLPDHIKDVKDGILKEIIGCAHDEKCDHGCTGAFRIIPQELEFYRRFNLPPPRLCVNCRHRERLTKRNSLRLYDRRCQCAGTHSENKVYTNDSQNHQPHKPDQHCPNEFQTSYAPDREEIVYCEPCYQAEVV